MMTMVDFIMQTNGISKERFVWNYEWAHGFMEKQLLGSYSMKMLNNEQG
jgi:hypothetical protein